MVKKTDPTRVVACPIPGHVSGSVRRHGTREANGVEYQRYLCRPTNGDPPHTLKAFITELTRPEPSPYSPPERCPTHPASRTVRDGKTRSARGIERQRYRCTPANGDPVHRFTPAPSRLAVDHGETCPECARERGVNQGDTNAGHGYKFTTRIIAAALADLAGGSPYGAVGVAAKAQMDARYGHRPLQPDLEPDWDTHAVREARKRARRRAWRLSADWVAAFSPVLYQPWAAVARGEVDAALAGSAKDRPVVALLLDDIPIFTKARNGQRQRQLFSVLAASESFIDRDNQTRVTRLRLLRAYPDHSAEAYKLVLAELGYVPDIIVADGGPGIGAAVRALAERNPGRPFTLCLSAYHLRRQLLRQFSVLTKPHGFRPGDLEDRLADWSFCASSVAWQTWWGDYEARLVAQGIPPSAWPNRWITSVKPVVDAQMVVFDETRVLPRSTGALEATLFEVVKQSMTWRGPGFGNLERTNRLLDLMTLRANGSFDNLHAVTDALAADARNHEGFVPPVRVIADVRLNRSLHDDTIPARLVKQAGL